MLPSRSTRGLQRLRSNGATEVAFIDMLSVLFVTTTLLVHPLAVELAVKSEKPIADRAKTLDLTVTTSGVFVDGKGPTALDKISTAIGAQAKGRHLKVVVAPGVGIELEHEVLVSVMTVGAKSITLGLSGPHKPGETP